MKEIIIAINRKAKFNYNLLQGYIAGVQLKGHEVKSIKQKFKIPVLSYQVSGEYSLLKDAINKGLIDESSVIETLISFKRAGANAIVTYFADKVCKKLT